MNYEEILEIDGRPLLTTVSAPTRDIYSDANAALQKFRDRLDELYGSGWAGVGRPSVPAIKVEVVENPDSHYPHCRIIGHVENIKQDEEGIKVMVKPNLDPNRHLPRVTNIIYNDPATIVFWDDGTKTVVKKQKRDKKGRFVKFDKYQAFTAALAIKYFGNNSRVNAIVEAGIDQTKKNKKGNK